MSDIVIYEDGTVELSATVENETVWLNQKQMSELFGKSVKTINEHIANVFKEGELEKDSTIRKFRIAQTEGNIIFLNKFTIQKSFAISAGMVVMKKSLEDPKNTLGDEYA